MWLNHHRSVTWAKPRPKLQLFLLTFKCWAELHQSDRCEWCIVYNKCLLGILGRESVQNVICSVDCIPHVNSTRIIAAHPFKLKWLQKYTWAQYVITSIGYSIHSPLFTVSSSDNIIYCLSCIIFVWYNISIIEMYLWCMKTALLFFFDGYIISY